MSYRYYSAILNQQKEKDTLIFQLSEELKALRQNEQDYILLENQALAIKQKYSSLTLEKNRIAEHLSGKLAASEAQIQAAEQEWQTLNIQANKEQLNLDRLLEVKSQLETETKNNSLRIDQLKRENDVILEALEKGERDNRNLNKDAEGLREDIRKWEVIKAEYTQQNKANKSKLKEAQSYLDSLRLEEGKVKGVVTQLEKEIAESRLRMQQLEEELKLVRASIDKKTEENRRLLNESIQRQNNLEKTISETNHELRLLGFETKKRSEIEYSEKATGNIVKKKNQHLNTLREDNQALERDVLSIEQQNQKLYKLINDLSGYMNTLTSQNERILKEIDTVMSQDMEIRKLLDLKFSQFAGLGVMARESAVLAQQDRIGLSSSPSSSILQARDTNRERIGSAIQEALKTKKYSESRSTGFGYESRQTSI